MDRTTAGAGVARCPAWSSRTMGTTVSSSIRRLVAGVSLILVVALVGPLPQAVAADPPVTIPSSGAPAPTSTTTTSKPATTTSAAPTTTTSPQPATRIISMDPVPTTAPAAGVTSTTAGEPAPASSPARPAAPAVAAPAAPTAALPLPPVAVGEIVDGLHPTPVDPTVATSLQASTAFLYSGDNPVQLGVAPGTIDRRRAAVLRGAVRDAAGEPLAGVTVAVKDHQELGRTVTRRDGMFDLAVNGGGSLVVTYGKGGLPPAQRRLDVPWGEYVWVPDVVLVAPGPAAGAVALDVAHDDGTVEHLAAAVLRATAFGTEPGARATVPAGPVPAPAPAQLFDLSVDEAARPGVTAVDLTRPLVRYLPGPAGPVPTSRYDRERAVWVPGPDGRAVTVVGVAGGAAQLDADGDGDHDDADLVALAALGVTGAELADVAAAHPPGASLWRLTLDHLGTWAAGAAPAAGGTPDPAPAFPVPTVKPAGPAGPAQVVPVAGTPFVLRSADVGSTGTTIVTRVTGAALPPDLTATEVTLTVAGTRRTVVLAPAANQVDEFTWQGFDAYGRRVQGRFPAEVTVTYLYGPERRRSASESHVVDVERSAGGAALDGWTVDVQSVLDLDGATLHAGDGTERNLRTESQSRSAAGNAGLVVDAVAAGPDGSLYVAGENRVRRIAPDGGVTTFAGSGAWGFSGDGGPAADASFRTPSALAVGPDGAVYVVDRWNYRVRRIGPDGRISTVAGDGWAEGVRPGAPAISSSIGAVADIAAGADGRVHLLDGAGGRVLELGTDGILRSGTAAGNDGRGSIVAGAAGDILVAEPSEGRVVRAGADGRTATVVELSASSITGLAAMPGGGVAFIADGVLRVVGPDGALGAVPAGGGADGPAPPALDLAVSPDGVRHVASGVGLVEVGAPGLTAGPDGGTAVRTGDGSQELRFDVFGRHLQTVDAATGDPRYTFGYDGQGRLAEIREPADRTTRILRDAGGSMTFVAPAGQRTTVAARRPPGDLVDPATTSVRGLDVPAVVLQAYRDAAEAARQRLRCDLRWSVLAAIGKSESNHGRAGGSTVLSNGAVVPAIVGIPLDGVGGVERIVDTDMGALDNDTVLDRAVGPMQFIPATWRSVASDGNGDGVADVQNVFDAAFGAARYLCQSLPVGRIADRGDLARAVGRYNHSSTYVAKVLADVDLYDSLGVGVRTGSVVGAYALPIDRALIDVGPAMLDQPHHDYPALDLPLPTGTPVYAVAGGRVRSVDPGGLCGNGVVVAGDDGYVYTYCHADAAAVTAGAVVVAGQLVMRSGNTGNSDGPHLHLQVARPDGTLVCPQGLLRAWYLGDPKPAASAVATGCVR